MDATLYSGEAQLAGWSDSHSGGVKVTLWLPDPSALEPFRDMTVRKGNTAGQVLMVAMVEVGNDGKPVPQPPKPQRLSTVAALMCDNPNFWRWLGEQYGVAPNTPDEAADVMRDALNIASRAELDSSPEKAALFHEIIRKPFVEWAS